MTKLKSLTAISSFTVIALSLVSCASSIENLQRATASKIDGASMNQISVDNIDRGVTSVTWDATYDNNNYKCDSDDMVRNVNSSIQK